LEKVLRAVGETALRVSRRRLAALPKMRGCRVLICSFGRCSGRCWIIGSCAMAGTQAGDAATDDIVESIMGEEQVASIQTRGGKEQAARGTWAVIYAAAGSTRGEVEHGLTQALAAVQQRSSSSSSESQI
jgi:hypothetical protein